MSIDRPRQDPLWNLWRSMLSRCQYRSNRNFKYYGAQGVAVCDRWKQSFYAFKEDVGPRPSRNHSLDRFPDRNGNYEPGNVRWATYVEQNRNKSGTLILVLDGRRDCIAGWADSTGIPYWRISQRLRKGWTVRRSLTEPPRNYNRSSWIKRKVTSKP